MGKRPTTLWREPEKPVKGALPKPEPLYCVVTSCREVVQQPGEKCPVHAQPGGGRPSHIHFF